MPAPLDLTGQRFGRLIATERLGTIKGSSYWAVKCDCGGEDLVRADNLTSGDKKSCGCLSHETRVALGKSKLKHGGTSNGSVSPEYQAWMNAKKLDQLVPEWMTFQQFFKDVGWKPSPEHQLKRRDVRKPHGPENTYWKDPNEIKPTHADLGDEFFLDMRGAFTRTAETIEEGATTAQCILR